MELPPFASRTEAGEWRGSAVELFRDTARDIGCDVEFIAMSPPAMLRALEREEVDAIALPFTSNLAASSVVTLTPSFATSTPRIAVYREDIGDDLTLLFDSLTTPRQMQVYGIMLALVVVFAMLVWLIERKRNQHFHGRRHEGIGSGLWWSVTTLSTVGYGDKVPISPLGRLIAGAWMMLSLVLVAIFTATITSSITAHDASVEVHGANDLPRARVGIVENGLASGYMSDHFLPHVSYPELSLAIADLQSGELDAVVADESALDRAIANVGLDHIRLIEQPLEVAPVSFGLNKALSRDLIRRFESALVARIEANRATKSAARVESGTHGAAGAQP
ncbi:MAG: ion channel [bacterium]